MKIYLSEYAKSKQAMEDNIGNRVDVIIEHLIKLILLPQNESRKHWEGEIAGQLNRVHKLKNKNKYPTKGQLLDWTYYYAEDDMKDISWLTNEISNIELDYDTKVTIAPQELSIKLNLIAYDYFIWLSNILSIDGSVSNMKIYQKLEEIV